MQINTAGDYDTSLQGSTAITVIIPEGVKTVDHEVHTLAWTRPKHAVT